VIFLKQFGLRILIWVIWSIYRLGYYHGKIETRIKVMIGR
jgi:hypothetical protein